MYTCIHVSVCVFKCKESRLVESKHLLFSHNNWATLSRSNWGTVMQVSILNRPFLFSNGTRPRHLTVEHLILSTIVAINNGHLKHNM